MSLPGSRDRNVSNKNHHKFLASRTIRSLHQENNLCGPFFHRTVFDSVRQLIRFHLKLNLEIFRRRYNTPASFQWNYTDPRIINQSINQSSIEAVAAKTVQTEEVKMASCNHRSLFYASRTIAQNSIGFIPACQGNSPQPDRAQKSFRLATVWNKGVWFSTDSSWRIRSLYISTLLRGNQMSCVKAFCQMTE